MRKWLVLVVPVVLLVTAGSRLVAVQEQALALREAVVGSLAGDDALAQAVWEQVCHTGLAQQSELSCLRLFLGTEGEQGLAPEIELDPKLLATYAYGFGRHLEEAQAVSSAIFSYQLSLEIAPNQQTADRLTQLLVRENREGEAIVVWDRIAAASPVEDPGHWWALGQAEELQQDWELAADAYGQGARSSEEPDKFWLGRGGALQHLESWTQARQAYWRVLLLDPVHPVAYKALGGVCLNQEEYGQSGRWFWMTLQLRPEDTSSNFYMAQLLHRSGVAGTAVGFLTRALASHSGQPWPWSVQLGDWRLALGDQEGALEAYRQALVWQPGEDSIEERIEQIIGAEE